MSLPSAAIEAPATVTPPSPPQPAGESAGAATPREAQSLWATIKQNFVAGVAAPAIVVILGFSYMSLHSDIDRVEDRIDSLGDRIDQVEHNQRTEMNSRFAEQQTRIDRLDNKINEVHLELTTQINEVRLELTTQISEVRLELTTQISALSRALDTLVVRLEESGTIGPAAAAAAGPDSRSPD